MKRAAAAALASADDAAALALGLPLRSLIETVDLFLGGAAVVIAAPIGRRTQRGRPDGPTPSVSRSGPRERFTRLPETA